MTKSTSPKSTQTQSRRKIFSCPNGANRRASGAKTATTTANGGKQACFSMFSRWRQISNSNRMRNICRNGARSEADLAQCGALALPPPFFFLWLLVQFFFSTPPCSSKHTAKKITTRVRGPFHQSITAILTEEKREEKEFTKPTHVAVYLFRDLHRCVCVCVCVCVHGCLCVEEAFSAYTTTLW